MLCQICGEREAKLRVPDIGPHGVVERLMCLSCGEPHTVQPMEGVDARDGDLHFRLFLLPKEMVNGCTRQVHLIRWAACKRCRRRRDADRDDPCRKCGGRGTVRERVRLQVSVPPGLAPGKRTRRLRVRSEGSVRRDDGKRGDVYLHVSRATELVVEAGSSDTGTV